MSDINVSLGDLVSGVVAVDNLGEVWLEIVGYLGSVNVTFASGTTIQMQVNAAEYDAAKFQLSAPDAIKEATRKALASFFTTPEDYLGKQYFLMDHLCRLYGWTVEELREGKS